MTIKAAAWEKYIRVLSGVDKTASRKFAEFLQQQSMLQTEEARKAIIDFAYALTSKYGETAAAAACEMYDAIAAIEGATVAAAIPAETASYGEVAKTVNGMIKQEASQDMMGNAIGRLVKRAGVDTTLKNAIRDGAEFAWIPHGDTCAFCMMLASNGWQRASKKALKDGHAEHVHANCDCTYAIRHDSRTNYAGYHPEEYLEAYNNADGRTWQDKVNAMRREKYAENGTEINRQKREAYAARKERTEEA